MVGSVAVDKTNGYRIGKGEGYADMEIAILNQLGLIDNNTKFIATVHDCQVFDALQDDLFDVADVRLDYICTPTQIIEIERKEKYKELPYKINWDKLDQDRINEMPVLKHLLSKNNDNANYKQTRYKSHKVSRW